jgi:hypothetical protein
VIVPCSYPFKTSTNGSNHPRCNWLRNIVESKIFKTRPIIPVFSGTRGRRFKSSQARHFSLLISRRSHDSVSGFPCVRTPKRDKNVIIQSQENELLWGPASIGTAMESSQHTAASWLFGLQSTVFPFQDDATRPFRFAPNHLAPGAVTPDAPRDVNSPARRGTKTRSGQHNDDQNPCRH